jgi:hypothetical protein
MASMDGITHQRVEPGDAVGELFGFLGRRHGWRR